MEREQMMTVCEVVAEFPALRNASAVYRVARQGLLPSWKVAGRVLFAREDVEAYLAGCRRMGSVAAPRKFVSKVILAGA